MIDYGDEEREFQEALQAIFDEPELNPANLQANNRKVTHLAKNDPRNDFARIIESAFNSADPDFFLETFRFLLAPSCKLEALKTERKRKAGGSSSSSSNQATLYANDINASVELSVVGVDQIVGYFTGCMAAIPDAIFLIHEWKIFPRSHNGCSLVTKFSYTGSYMFDSNATCIIRDRHQCYDRDPMDDLEEDTLDPENGNTIQFRERSRASKYDYRKRNKRATLGEFVSKHGYQPDKIPEISFEALQIAETKDDHDNDDHSATTEKSAMDKSCGKYVYEEKKNVEEYDREDDSKSDKNSLHDEADDRSCKSLSNTTISTNHTVGGSTFAVYEDQGTKRGIKSEATTMNARGIMRWTIGPDNKVTLIQCHRIME